jgi:NAD(P)-dependent dehydrogenase (short-subunit alcohol dehydrogenase family)
MKNRKYVLVTGASSGIGNITSVTLANAGFSVIAGVRKQEDAESLKSLHEAIVPVFIDVTNNDSINTAFNQISEIVGESGLYGIVNNAGVAIAGPLEFLPIDRLRQQMEINVIGQINVTQHALPLIRKAQGRIVNISSIAGFTAFPFKGAYAASKFAIEALSDSLRRELTPWKIPVSVIEPGVIKTPIWEKSINLVEDIVSEMPPQAEKYYGSVYRNLLGRTLNRVNKKGASPSQVAKAILHALTAKCPKTRYLVGKDAHFLSYCLTKFPDNLIDAFICKRVGLDKCEFSSCESKI